MPSGWGYARFWLAEHHDAVGDRQRRDSGRDRARRGRGRRRIRVGAGGDHAARTIRRSSSPSSSGRWRRCTRAAIDLGLGRAPGTDQAAAVRALRRDLTSARSRSRGTSSSCSTSCATPEPRQAGAWRRRARARGAALDPRLEPVRRASSRRCSGCPTPSRRTSRRRRCCRRSSSTGRRFKPSEQLERPHAMVGINAIVADDDETARRLFDVRAAAVHEHPARPPRTPAAARRRHASRTGRRRRRSARRRCSAARTSARRSPCARASKACIAETEPDELDRPPLAIHDHAARLRSVTSCSDELGGAGRDLNRARLPRSAAGAPARPRGGAHRARHAYPHVASPTTRRSRRVSTARTWIRDDSCAPRIDAGRGPELARHSSRAASAVALKLAGAESRAVAAGAVTSAASTTCRHDRCWAVSRTDSPTRVRTTRRSMRIAALGPAPQPTRQRHDTSTGC